MCKCKLDCTGSNKGQNIGFCDYSAEPSDGGTVFSYLTLRIEHSRYYLIFFAVNLKLIVNITTFQSSLERLFLMQFFMHKLWVNTEVSNLKPSGFYTPYEVKFMFT
jgi:hypothetical protein